MTKARDIADLGGVTTRLDQVGNTDGALSNRSLIINGAMTVAQRGVSATGLGNTATYATCDRWEQQGSAATGRYTSTQTGITDLVGFRSCLKFNCTTADTSTGAGEYLILAHKFEGFNVSHIGMGSSEAKELTLSFYAKGNAPAQYTAQFQTAQSYEVSKSFNVTSEWQRFEITYPANTVANPLDNNNTGQLFLQIWLNSGSTYSGGSALNETWGNPANNTMAVGNSNFYSSTDNEFFITGVQLELGDTATPFEHISVGDQLQKCQRYYQNVFYGGVANHAGYAQSYGNWYTLPTPMRAAPTVSVNSNNTFYDYPGGNQNSSDLAFEGVNVIHNTAIRGRRTTTSNMTYLEGRVICDAEL